MPKKDQISDHWAQELTNETEHYFQSEMQQDQRASWLLATTSALIALLMGLRVTAAERGIDVPSVLFLITVGAYFLSAIVSIMALLPMRGIKSPWVDLWGKSYRRSKKLAINDLVRERFRNDDKWSDDSLETRLKYHFRSHYLRNSKKSYGVMWASIFLLVGLFTSVLLAFSQFYQITK